MGTGIMQDDKGEIMRCEKCKKHALLGPLSVNPKSETAIKIAVCTNHGCNYAKKLTHCTPETCTGELQ